MARKKRKSRRATIDFAIVGFKDKKGRRHFYIENKRGTREVVKGDTSLGKRLKSLLKRFL
ncbi:hypothetical protein DRP04_06425 [Archaeoglobales archaeon]|nr:MAG: hypothetical protein DRP04_06425 [Archaeoglobales archaeon]